MLIRNKRSELFCLYHCLLFAGSLFTFTPGLGQEVTDFLYHHISSERSAGWSCYFTYPQGSGTITPDLGNNAGELEKLDAFISWVLSHPNLFISRIRLTGYSSIEGSYARNELLSYDRVEGFSLYLREHYPQLSLYPYDRAWVAEDWSGLADRVRTSHVKEREEILDIIRKVSAFDTREALLAKLNGGHAWFYLSRDIFPQLRRVEIRFEFSTTPNINIATRPSGDVQTGTGNDQWRANDDQWRANERQGTGGYNTGGYAPQASAQAGSSENTCNTYNNTSIAVRPSGSQYIGGSSRSSRLWILSPGFVFKTNLLLLAGVQSDFSYTTPVINGALEYRIDPHWSVELGAMYSYWHHNSRLEFQGVSGYRLEPRYRLGLWNGRFGIYSGLYGRFGDYNVRRAQETGNTGDADEATLPTLNYTGKYWDAGVSVGATFKLIGGLGLEAGIRCGYVSSSPYKYILDQDQIPRIESRWRYSKVGITDLSISLTYQLTMDK